MEKRHILEIYYSVLFLKTNSGKKGEGMPVVRNPQFYFREGFCWNNVLTTYMKCKKKEKTVQSTESMSFTRCIYNHRTTKTNQKYPSVNL